MVASCTYVESPLLHGLGVPHSKGTQHAKESRLERERRLVGSDERTVLDNLLIVRINLGQIARQSGALIGVERKREEATYIAGHIAIFNCFVVAIAVDPTAFFF